MRIARLLKTMLIVGVVSACLCLLAACGSNTGGVAATVNGTEISEDSVTKQVEKVRGQSGLTDDDQWGKFLVQNSLTPEKVRESIIDGMVDTLLIKEAAAELDISIDSADVDEAVSSFKEKFSSDEAWQDALKQAGFTEETYRDNIDSKMIEQKVGDYFDEQVEITDEDRVNSLKTYASYYDGAKRTSHILIKVDDQSDTEAVAAAEAKAQDILNQINNGLDFAEAARQYSEDEGSAEKGGDVGWDKLNSFVEAYTNGISDLTAGQVSEPITSEYGVHIIKVTAVYEAPEADAITSFDQIPEEFRDNIEEMAISVKADTLYKEWIEEIKETAEITINPMPKGLPYDIDLKPYEEEQAKKEAESAAESTDDGTDALVDDAAALDAEDQLTEDVLADNGIDGATVDDGTVVDETTVPEAMDEDVSAAE